MRLRKQLVKVLVLLVVLTGVDQTVLQGQSYAKVGIVGAQFLKIGVGAKYLGMGSASMALVNDVQSIYWNPSGLTSIRNYSAVASQLNWLAGIQYGAGAIAKNFRGLGVVGLSFSYLSSGDMEVTTYDQQEGTGETFKYTDLMLGVSWARKLTDHFSFGTTVKLVVEDYGIKDDVENKAVKAQVIAFDIGAQYLTGFRSLKMGLTIQNFGPELQPSGKYGDIIGYDSQTQQYVRDEVESFKSYAMPMTFRVGIGMDVLDRKDHKITIATDVIHPSDNVERINLGGQYMLYNMLAIRGGYILNADAARFSLGMGINYRIVEIDYAYLVYGILDAVQTFSVVFNF